MLSKVFNLSTWGMVCASATVLYNPYFSPSEPEEPKYIIEGLEVWRGEEGLINRGLSRSDLAEIEERLVEAFEMCQAYEEASRVDLEIDTHRLEYA